MKLKTVLLVLISFPVMASVSDFAKVKMPNESTILAVLNSNNEGRSFLNSEKNRIIASSLAKKEFTREEVVALLFQTTESRNVPEISLKATSLMQIAQAVMKRPGLEQ